MPGNPAYTNPPVDPTVLKATLDKFSVAITEALDGGKKAIAEKNKLRGAVGPCLRQAGLHRMERSRDPHVHVSG